jgi:nitrate/nitrite transporter NarK
MKDIIDAVDWTILVAVGIALGIVTVLIAKRYVLRIYTALAGLIGVAGGALGSFLLNDLFGWLNDPVLNNVSILPLLIGAVILLAPFWAVLAGRTPYGNKRTWQRKYRR